MSENEVSSPGGTVGSRIAKLVSDATVYSRQKLGPHQNQIAQKVMADFTNHISDEVRSVMGPIWRQMEQNPDVPEEIKPLLHALGNMRGQAWAWIGGSATGAAMGAGLIDLLNNLLAPVIQPLIAADPNATLPPDTAAAAEVRGFGWSGERATLEYDAQAGGIDRKRYQVLQDLSRVHPTLGELQELHRRGEVYVDEFFATLHKLGYDRKVWDKLRTLSFNEHSMPDISAMWNRSIVNDDEAIRLGEKAGYNRDQVKQLLELGGEPLGPMELGEAFRRGFIDSARFNRGIIQGPLRNEWFDVLEKLQIHRMSTVDAADAVNQGHMSESEGRQIAHENGLDPSDFDTLLETAGQPPGIEFAQEAWNRGMISEGEFSAMFLESRIKNRYLPLLKAMRVRLIPQETARMLYREGVYSKKKTLETLMAHGFSSDDAASLVALEEARGDAETKELTRAQIVGMYGERLFTREQSLDMLHDMGYPASSAEAMLSLEDLAKTRRFINSAVTRVRAAYVAGRMGEIDVSAQLDRLGIPVDQRDYLLAIWDIDRTTISKTLSPSQVRQAYRKDLITVEDALYRLESQGYDRDDAALFLQLTA